MKGQSVSLERSPESVDNTVYHITNDILLDRLSQANACMQHLPSMLCTSLPSNSHECGTMDSILIPPLHLQANMCGHGSSFSCNDHCLDGCDLIGSCSIPQYLIMANLLLVESLQGLKRISDKDVAFTTTWWACRTHYAHQRILAEP